MDTNKIKVNIAGTVYTIIGEKTRAEVEEIANFVDEEIKKITSHNYLLNSTMAATLVALNISSDYFDLKKEINLLREDSEFPIKKQEEFLKNNQKIEKENDFDMDYLAFENKYRGSEENIQKLQEKFVRLYAGKDNILDIGCGRGEFIKTLLNAGKQYVFGMDINPQMVEKCKKDGLSVELRDGVSYLYDNDNLNLGGIFSSQVIEHLKPSQIVKLIKGAYKNLQEGSPLILETINPMALVTQTMAYTLDLTHRQYVHPFTIEMLLKEHGFKKVEFIYSSPVDIEAPVLKDNDMDPKELEKYNEKIRRMHEMLFGYQDYAVIAWK